MNATIGAAVARKEDRRFITGTGRYTDDINIPDAAHAFFLRSPHAHAAVNGIDASAAAGAPGVLGVFTGDDLAADRLGGLICGWMVHSADGSPMKAGPHPLLAQGVVRHVGEPVVMIVAETAQQARNAAEAVRIDYAPLPACVELAEAQNPGAPQVHAEAPQNTSFDWEIGDADAVEQAFQSAAHVSEISLTNNRLIPNAMEPRAAIGCYDRGQDRYTLYTTSQNPHVARLVMSAFINVAPEHKLRVIAPDVGGGFGSKIYIYSEEVSCVWAAKKVGRAVRWTADRSEAFITDAHGRDHISNARIALDAEGRILGLKVDTVANLGAYMSLFSSCVPTYLYACLLSGQYNIPAIHARVRAVYTHTASVDAYRGAGRPEATYLLERLVETAARDLGVDPAELRRRNFVNAFPHQTPVIMCYDAGDFPGLLEKAKNLIDYDGFSQRRAQSEAKGMKRGIGISCYIEACGIAPSAAVGSLGCGVGLWESAEVRVNPTGNVEILTGSHSHGQGHETTFAQLASARLGIPIDNIEIVHGDTDKVQFGMGTYGSRSGPVGMTAISKAIDKVEAKAKRIAAHLLEADENDVEFKDGAFTVVGTDKSKAFAEVALAAYTAHNLPASDLEPGLKESAFHDPANFTFPAGCHICEVEIDPDTGVPRIEKYVVADDFGTIVNPLIVSGQVHGGLAQGIGQAMLEECRYDANGQLLTGSYMDYCMPRADDVPSFDLETICTPCPSNPIGMKGCGEAGAIGSPPAVINAIAHALGVRDFSMPATPEKIWRTIAEADARAA